MWTLGLDQDRWGDALELPFYMDVLNLSPTLAAVLVPLTAIMFLSSFKLEPGESAILVNAFNGKTKGVVEGPGRTWLKPWTGRRAHNREIFDPNTGTFPKTEYSRIIITKERQFEKRDLKATTKDGVEVTFVLSVALRVANPIKYVEVSEDPLATILADIAKESSPLFAIYNLDKIRSDRDDLEDSVIKKVKDKAAKYGLEIARVSIGQPVLSEEHLKALSAKATAELREQAAELSGRGVASMFAGAYNKLLSTTFDNSGDGTTMAPSTALAIAERFTLAQIAATGTGTGTVMLQVPAAANVVTESPIPKPR